MSDRKLSRDEFVQRMLADQALKEERKRQAQYNARGYFASRKSRAEHRAALKYKSKGRF
jgi:hypothetical protein